MFLIGAFGACLAYIIGVNTQEVIKIDKSKKYTRTNLRMHTRDLEMHTHKHLYGLIR